MFNRLLLLAAMLVLAVFSPLLPALAADTKVDFSPLIQTVVIPAIGAIATLLLGLLVKKSASWLGEDTAHKLAGTLDQGLHYALAYGQAEATRRLAGAGASLKVDVKDETVAQAANYAVQQFPDLLKKLGVDQAGLIQKLEARYAYNTTPPELSAAIPTPPAPAA